MTCRSVCDWDQKWSKSFFRADQGIKVTFEPQKSKDQDVQLHFDLWPIKNQAIRTSEGNNQVIKRNFCKSKILILVANTSTDDIAIAKCRPSIQIGFHVNNLHQQMRETVTKYFTVIFFPNTMMSFLYISTASAPIQNTAARVKYWMNSDMTVQPASVSVRSSPTRTNSSMKNMAILSCVCNLLASRWRIFLKKKHTHTHTHKNS